MFAAQPANLRQMSVQRDVCNIPAGVEEVCAAALTMQQVEAMGEVTAATGVGRKQ